MAKARNSGHESDIGAGAFIGSSAQPEGIPRPAGHRPPSPSLSP